MMARLQWAQTGVDANGSPVLGLGLSGLSSLFKKYCEVEVSYKVPWEHRERRSVLGLGSAQIAFRCEDHAD